VPARRRPFPGAIDLQVVLDFPLTRQAGVEGLVLLVVAVSLTLEQASPHLCQHHRRVAIAGRAGGLD
jgi:hypothetical protein